mmetsp:Transcript_10053/g.10158  ORF Transcript_10053/g.10158 Transcript_10053/m.10158 type:complete len:349 (+) Transcript_10053:25-1071(+)
MDIPSNLSVQKKLLKKPESGIKTEPVSVFSENNDEVPLHQHSKGNSETSSELKSIAQSLGISDDRTDSIVNIVIEEESKVEEEISNIIDEEQEKDKDNIVLPIGPNISIFDNKEFPTTEDCIIHMKISNGFFIPDREYITDMNGLLQYLGEKVKLGGICLYCQRQFSSGTACQHHMLSKSHCKVAYEDEVDMDEFEDFYDFSSSYLNDNGDVEEGDRTLEISSIGEMILLDGRVVGNRNLRIYYKQRYRPEDTRPAVLAQKREELLKYGCGIDGVQLDSREVQLLSDTQLAEMMMRKKRELRKALIVQQRAQQKVQYASQHREYQSTVDKLRSHATTTDKIRDWHRKL